MNELPPEKLKKLLAKAQRHDDIVLAPPWGANANRWAAEVARVLEAHYPKWRWGVGVWAKQGVVVIINLDLQTDWKITIRMDDIDFPNFRIVKRLAGEFVERCNIPTTPRTTPEYTEYAPKKNHAGDLLVDLAGVPKGNY